MCEVCGSPGSVEAFGKKFCSYGCITYYIDELCNYRGKVNECQY